MNSCLYRCEVMHQRLEPKKHGFRYSIFMFYLDLDELDLLTGKVRLFSRNHFNWFSFHDADHLSFPQGVRNGKSLKQNVMAYLESHGISLDGGKIRLLTNTRILGYGFNPISMYLCFAADGKPVCSVAEVCNTHGEMKLFLLEGETFKDDTFRKLVPKLFYVSPFADLSSSFDFIFRIPDESLLMRVDDYQEGRRFLLSSLSGQRRTMNDMNLLWYGIRFPLITLKIIVLIHWQAFVLFCKRIPFNRKSFNLHLQQEAYPYKKV